ncbi:MAG TPA: DUF4032 domain-containing protein [Microbacteriaceae bacterium]|nr:DUF4032 domain-containing protein [Microbacteriaceae bacterium]
MGLEITSKVTDTALWDLPWSIPLDEWRGDHVVAMPKGISRHLVRFAALGDRVVAIKETTAELALREYALLRELRSHGIPAVKPLAVVDGRIGADGEALKPALVTRHLKFSLPYRAVFSQSLRPETATRLVDALAVLLVRLHTAGFFWGDVSLSNTLFRRDAGAFAAYLVDAETGEFVSSGLSDGQRENDLEIARVNIAGELLDLEAAGHIEAGLDPIGIANGIVSAYRALWSELTEPEEFAASDRWKIDERVQRLNDLGFDIAEMAIQTDDSGSRVRIRPKVVDAGHHQRRLLRLTGLDAEENQARRLLNDLDRYRAEHSADLPEERAAAQWMSRVFEPIVRSVPPEYRGKLAPAEIFHQFMEHRWYLAERRGAAVPMSEALSSYIYDVLAHRRDEAELINPPTGAFTSVIDVVSPKTGAIRTVRDCDDEDDTVADWRDLV